MELTQINYDRPAYHTQTQTIFKVYGKKNVIANSIRLIDLKLNLDTPSNFNSFCGVYGVLKEVILKIGGREVNKYNAPELYTLILNNTSHEVINDLDSVLFGNSGIYFDAGNALYYKSVVVDANSQSIYLNNLLKYLGSTDYINKDIEIIITWNTSLDFVSSVVASMNIDPPYLSYETVNTDVIGKSVVDFYNYIRDMVSVPAQTSVGTQELNIRITSLNNKFIKRLFIIEQLQDDAGAGKYYSASMKGEVYNISVDGTNILTFKNTSSDAVKNSMLVDAGVNLCGYPNCFTNSAANPVYKNPDQPLNGVLSYGCVELDRAVNKQINLNYRRTTSNDIFGSALFIILIAEVLMRDDGESSKYLLV